MMKRKQALTVAGSDSMGGAGIQADLKTFEELDVHGMSVITAIVAQQGDNIRNIYPQPLEGIEAQFDTAVTAVGVAAMKTGMLFSKDIIECVAEKIQHHHLTHIVVDPVMVTKSGAELLQPEAAAAMKNSLIPLATVVTPNLPEAAKLADRESISSLDEMKDTALQIKALGPEYVLIKGGAMKQPEAVDLLYDGAEFTTFRSEYIDTLHTNGAGCTYSAALTAELAKGKSVNEAVKTAKTFVTEAIRHAHPGKTGRGWVNQGGYRKVVQ